MIEYTDSAYHTKTSDEDFAYSLGSMKFTRFLYKR